MAATARPPLGSTTGFLNVDLEVGARTRVALAPLVDALRGTLFELFCGRLGRGYCAHYEVRGCSRDASRTIHELAATLEALDRPARRAWDTAALRDFNIGIELSPGQRSIELAIDRDAISRITALRGRIVFTAYQVAAMQAATLGRAIEWSDQRARPATAGSKILPRTSATPSAARKSRAR